MTFNTQNIPKSLVYEMQEGNPVFYRNYKECLNGTKTLEEIMGSSFLRSWLISKLMFHLQLNLGDNFAVLTNEIGIQLSKKSWRAADIAVIDLEKRKGEKIDNKYLTFPPQLIIEIDTKAELSAIENPLGYYHQKTDELLQFGVEKVVWIFSDSKKVMIAEPNKNWKTFNWNQPFAIIKDIEVNIENILPKNSI